MARTLTIRCEKTGGGAYLVDDGRKEHGALGVPCGGPADPFSVQAARRLLQQAPNTPCLELTLTGGRWWLAGEGQICLTGADMGWRLDGHPINTYSAINLNGEALLSGGQARNGLRGYLSASGNWDLPRRLGSVGAGVPGILPVVPGWHVRITGKTVISDPAATATAFLPVAAQGAHKLVVQPGPEWSLLRADQQRQLLGEAYRIGRDSNRQGIRLAPAGILAMRLPPLISSPVLPGTIQLTPTGPVLLGPDAQTIGGYPRVLLVTDAKALAMAFQLPLDNMLRLVLE